MFTFILGGFISISLGVLTFIFFLIFASLAFIYSYPRIYLKRYVKTIIIGFGSALAFGMGYYSIGMAEHSSLLFLKLFGGIFLVFTLGSAINDLKDYKADKYFKIKTLFTVFGLKKGKIIGAILVSFAFLLPALIFPDLLFYFLIFAILSCVALHHEKILIIYLFYFGEYFLCLTKFML